MKLTQVGTFAALEPYPPHASESDKVNPHLASGRSGRVQSGEPSGLRTSTEASAAWVQLPSP